MASTSVYLHPLAPGLADSAGWEAALRTLPAGHRVTSSTPVGNKMRSWAREDVQMSNGLFTIRPDETRPVVPRRVPGAAGAEPRLLTRIPEPLEDVRVLLDLRTSCGLALEALSQATLDRPASAQTDIERCRRWLDNSALQYLTGRGAQRQVVEPWNHWVDAMSQALDEIERTWRLDVEPTLRIVNGNHPLRPLIAPLGLVKVDRDRLILAEYKARAAGLSRECQRVSSEIGVVGTLVSLALVPATEPLGLFFLAPVVIAGMLYYGGYRIANTVLNLLDRFGGKRNRFDFNHRGRGGGASGSNLQSFTSKLRTRSIRILAGPRMGVVDAGCALALQWSLLALRSGEFSQLDSVIVTHRDEAAADDLRIVIGGPLVRVQPASRATPVCYLASAGTGRWHIYVEGCPDPALDAATNELTGVLSTATLDENVLFLYGTRDAGTVLATRELQSLVRGVAPPRRSWRVVQRPRNHASQTPLLRHDGDAVP